MKFGIAFANIGPVTKPDAAAAFAKADRGLMARGVRPGVRRPARPRTGLAPTWPVVGRDPAALDDRWLLTPWPDGWRCLVLLDDRVRLRSRIGHDLAPFVPALAAALEPYRPRGAARGTTTILDAVLRAPPEGEEGAASLVSAVGLDVVDLLCREGRDHTGRGLRGRLEELRGMGLRERDGLRMAAAFRGAVADAWSQGRFAGKAGADGLLARRDEAPYRPGLLSRDWVLFEPRRLHEFVLCGIASTGSLVLGFVTTHGLAFGGVTWPTREWRSLAARCREAAPPFPEPGVWPSLGRIAWAHPELWVAVEADVRAGSGAGGPAWRYVRCQEDLSS